MNDFSGKRCVFIDDDNMNLMIVSKKLENHNLIVDKGKNMAELFELLKTNEYDIIFLDDMMPKMSGTQAMKELKKQNFSRPIVVITGNCEDPNSRDNYINEGFDEFISKPVKDEVLDQILDLFLK